ncbi:restriction endonuclease subunit S (plasmid) [Cyanobacterium sp. IPPAS B-1200]|uniref:restriction endonuclease subunit S n=1 Tax=Cyanobacterium sp. IPPAS B-1200 TaxID=1562720 RepID=UPI0008527B1D|nr:restriction endonuclease subunit S [Cyanobacterium sp. IPPAS B-1200]OEJ78377.1 hypothetical protein A5482_13510 [Cyanobacterium sp. IPPAS B-1200]
MEWKVVKCQDVIDIRDGTHDTPKYVNVGYPLITSKNLKNGSIDFSEVSYISAEDYIEINKRSKVDKGDILFAMIGTIGNPVIVDVDKEFSIKNVALFKLKNSSVDPRFFKYFLESSIVKKQLERETKGGTQKFVSLKVLRNLKIPLPEIASQRRIAEILDKADEIIRKRKSAIALTEQLQKSIFLDMFGDPLQKNQEKVKLSEIAKIIMGQSPKGESYNTQGQGVPLLNGPAEFGENCPVEKQWTNKPTRICESGDILFCVRGATAGRLNWANKEYCIGRGLAAIRPSGSNKNYSEFIYLTLEQLYQYFQDKGVGSTFININRKEIEDLLIPKIDRVKADKFYQYAIELRKIKYKNTKALQESENLFNSLLQRAFKGEL